MGLKGSDPVGLVSWLKDLTYAEVHAATLGVIHGAATALAYSLGDVQLTLGLVGTAFVLLGIARRGTLKRARGVGRMVQAIPQSLREQIRDEPHYYGGPYVAIVAGAYFALNYGVL